MARPDFGGIGRPQTERIRVRDFLSRKDVELDSPDDGLSMEDTLIRGEFTNRQLRAGLTLHLGNAREERSFTARSYMQAGLSCVFFLDGEVDLKIGDRRLKFRGGNRGSVECTAIMAARADTFHRTSGGGQFVRHLAITAAPEWLNLEALPEAGNAGRLARLLTDHLASHRWTPTPKVMDLVRQVVAPSVFAAELRDLYLESRAVEIIGETLAAVIRSERRSADGTLLPRRDRIRLERAGDFIAANLAGPLRVDIIAREAGLNPSGLQRLFRLAHGVSILEFVRRLRLERARDALRSGEHTISDASLIAGYSTPANFATAFRRHFGVSPSEVQRHASG